MNVLGCYYNDKPLIEKIMGHNDFKLKMDVGYDTEREYDSDLGWDDDGYYMIKTPKYTHRHINLSLKFLVLYDHMDILNKIFSIEGIQE